MSPDLTESSPFEPSPDVVSRRVAGEYLLVPVRSGAAQMDYIFTVNRIGSVIFGLLDGRRDVGLIARLVSREFDVDPERAAADVVEFLRTLCEAGLARPASGAAR